MNGFVLQGHRYEYVGWNHGSVLRFDTFVCFVVHLQKMLDYLKDKRDVGFFQSLAGLMQSCR